MPENREKTEPHIVKCERHKTVAVTSQDRQLRLSRIPKGSRKSYLLAISLFPSWFLMEKAI